MTTEVKTTVPGNIWKVLVKEGDSVKKDDALFTDWSHILFDQALLSEGGQLTDPVSFVNKLNSMIVLMAK